MPGSGAGNEAEAERYSCVYACMCVYVSIYVYMCGCTEKYYGCGLIALILSMMYRKLITTRCVFAILFHHTPFRYVAAVFTNRTGAEAVGIRISPAVSG